ncbi:hypothetical protein AB6A40_003174 [Gnathostoma spinigerum]|uniref:Uncharacterized protein n=1 Tax=Gnathostoma spinigerum TaxID=75299 RepID=A0ABD6E9Y6_9BILA
MHGVSFLGDGTAAEVVKEELISGPIALDANFLPWLQEAFMSDGDDCSRNRYGLRPLRLPIILSPSKTVQSLKPVYYCFGDE